MIRKIVLASAAMALVAVPVAARQPQQTLNRASGPTASESRLGGSNLFFYLGIAAIAAAILLLSQNEDPVSA